MNLEQLLEQTAEIVKETGHYIQSNLGKVEKGKIEDKALNSLVSFVDRTAEMQLVEKLSSILPASTFLTEEGTVEQKDSPAQWIIDPLDGTTNFLHGIPYFVVSVGLRLEGQLALGVVYEPIRGELFSAAKGHGAFLNGQPIRVSNAPALKDSVVATGFPYYDYSHKRAFFRTLEFFAENARGIRRFGAAALDLAYVSCGRFDGFFEYSLNPWDVAAGIVLVQEAGGQIGDFQQTGNFLFGKEIIAANPAIFPEMEQVILNAFKEE